MGPTIVVTLAALFAGAGVTLVGVLVVVFAKRRTAAKIAADQKAEERLAKDVLRTVRYLTNRVVGDVESHSHQVAEVSARLAADETRPTMIKSTVQEILKVNQEMQEKLAQTEDQLRCQTAKLESNLADARIDPLTKLGNRRALEEELHGLMSNFLEQGRCFSLINVDVDHFKELNDLHGNVAGDEVLCRAAKVLARSVTENSFVARVGGTEFAILIQDTPLDEACTVAETARKAIQTGRFPHEGSNLSVTASFGVAELRKSADAAQLFHRADEALCMAKQSGNAVCFHDGKKTSRMSPAVLKTKSFVVTPSPEPSDKQSAKSAAARDAVPLPTVETSQNCFGLPNRTMFCNNVRTRISESKRSGAPFSILLLKLRLREKLTSEDAGTVPAAVLQKSASLIQSVVREMDSIAYYGQACFSILMPGVDPSASQDLAQRLQVQLSHLSTNSTQVDLVVGIATVGQGDDTVSLLKRAEIDLQRNQPTACLRG